MRTGWLYMDTLGFNARTVIAKKRAP